jgi:type IV secretory pathway VirB10-like protein
MKLIRARQDCTDLRMRNGTLLVLACCIGLSGGWSCATHQAPSSSVQPPPSQAEAEARAAKQSAEKERQEQAADAAAQKAQAQAEERKRLAAEQQAKAQRDQELTAARLAREQETKTAAAAAREQKEKDAAEAKARKEKDAAAAKALKQAQADAARQTKPEKPTNLAAKTTTEPVPTMDAKAPLTKEQKLKDLDRRYINGEITPQQYHPERARILAEP